ncbi:TetR/AcrR family transcriptional regulator [Streptomyces sp. NPDC001663]|uniref:TetR/AcrR family transcriptional regulator n=1 Tax=Streptomyces sp. NPDC001663 TaxID=3364597 RepID=UPI0036C140BF
MSRRNPATSLAGTPISRPLRADAERNRKRIVAAAQQVFAERGLAVTLDDIAHHAGVGVGTVYRRFANREALIEAVLEDGVRRLVAVAEAALTREDAWDGFRELFLTAAREFAENRGLREVLLDSAQGGTQVASAQDDLMPVVAAVVGRAQEAGALREDFEAMDFPLVQLMLGSVTERSREVAPDLWTRYATLLLDGLRRDQSEPSPLPHRSLSQQEYDQTLK